MKGILKSSANNSQMYNGSRVGIVLFRWSSCLVFFSFLYIWNGRKLSNKLWSRKGDIDCKNLLPRNYFPKFLTSIALGTPFKSCPFQSICKRGWNQIEIMSNKSNISFSPMIMAYRSKTTPSIGRTSTGLEEHCILCERWEQITID